jgi:hypothetical protein
MLLSGIHDFSHLQDRFPPRSVAGMTELGVLQLPLWFEFIDNNDGLNLAVKDLKDNFEMYIERYLKWQKK